MWPIFACSILSLTIILERVYYFFKAGTGLSADFSERVKRVLQEDSRKGYPEKEKIISRIGSQEAKKLEKNLRSLAIIGNITPLMGLLGTVTGMIKCFIKIEQIGGGVDVSALAGGIWEALLTTAAGLSVAIPTILFYHYFEARVDSYVSQMKDTAEELLN